MKSYIIILVGVVFFIFGVIRLLKFTNDLSEKINEINELFSSDLFLLHKELREELDELNFSYYEILERQDERITELEGVVISAKDLSIPNPSGSAVEMTDDASEAPPNKDQDRQISRQARNDTSAPVISSAAIAESRDLNPDKESLNHKVLAMNKEGKSYYEIATSLGIGIGMVETICKIYESK